MKHRRRAKKPAPELRKPTPELDPSGEGLANAAADSHTALPVTLAAGYTWHRGVLTLNGEDVER